jgi:thiamine-phosphate pyrophosphorylase
MHILITSEQDNSAEKERLLHFFKNGLQLLHVRKPEMKEKELKAWLSQFETEHLRKMVLHQHHHLADGFPLRGIHLKESFRRDLKDLSGFINRSRTKGFTVSTSFHDLEAVTKGASLFDYVFLGPVFSSISKKAYEGKGLNVGDLSQNIIALGGIESTNISRAKELGYAGVAVLGAVWLAENPLEAFVQIYNEYQHVYS